MGSNRSHFKGDDNRPVETVSREDIQRFEAKTGLRLPTEAQYACRGGEVTPFAEKPDEIATHRCRKHTSPRRA
jgi:formylglycine-generating enzyme required for sulfatase activity